jgi:hypothetical protein
MKYRIFKPIALFFLFISSVLYADISGIVFKDFNYNGTYEYNATTGAGDAVVIGVPVSAVCDDGTTATATTDENGTYTLTIPDAAKKCRVEVDPSSQGLGSSALSTAGATPLVDMVSNPKTNHDVPTASPATYCQEDPKVLVTALPGYSGSPGDRKAPTGFGTLFLVRNPQAGETNGADTVSTNRTVLKKIENTGAVWGLAWKKSSKELFMSAVIDRDIPLEVNGKVDPGAIYKMDTATNTLSKFVSISDTIPTNGFTKSCDVNTSVTALSQLLDANRDYNNSDRGYEDRKVWLCYTGQLGLGDLDISEDEKTLYTVNLYKKELVIIDTATKNITTKAILNPYGTDCADSHVRPWAVKARGNDV